MAPGNSGFSNIQRQRFRSPEGFTLIELLVVIAIIAILESLNLKICCWEIKF